MLLLEYLSKLELGDIYMLKDDVLNSLPPKLRMVYQSWLNGDDLKVILPRPTFYRYRKQMLAYGLDISTKSPKEKTNIIPLVRVLEAKPVGIPDWAYQKDWSLDRSFFFCLRKIEDFARSEEEETTDRHDRAKPQILKQNQF